jgi:hypothetical protein
MPAETQQCRRAGAAEVKRSTGPILRREDDPETRTVVTVPGERVERLDDGGTRPTARRATKSGWASVVPPALLRGLWVETKGAVCRDGAARGREGSEPPGA